MSNPQKPPPFRTTYMSQADIATAREFLRPLVTPLQNSDDPKGDLLKAIDEIARENYLGAVASYITDMVEPLIDRAGPVTIAKSGDETHALVAEVLKEYNAAHGTNLQMPTLIIHSKIGPAYQPTSDALMLSSISDAMNTEQKKTTIAHELAHKDQMERGEYPQVIYDARQHALSIDSPVDTACAAAGLSEDEIRLAMPSSDFARVARIAPADWRQTILNLADKREWLTQPLTMSFIALRANLHGECRAALKEMEDTQPAALEATHMGALKANRDMELDADAKAAAIYGQLPMSRTLSFLHAFQRYTPEQEVGQSHPAIQTRIENLGCSFTSSADATETELTCPATPAEGLQSIKPKGPSR